MIVFIITISLALGFSFANEVPEKRYHFARRMNVDTHGVNMNVYSFETLAGQGIRDCIESCKAKKLCKFINFDRRGKLCFLIGVKNDAILSVENYLEVKPGFYFGAKQEWSMEEEYNICDDCNRFGVCSNEICLDSGCTPPLKMDKAITKGNMYSVGNTVLYQCEDGYRTAHTNPVTSTCLGNGNWSLVKILCLPEAAFGQEVSGPGSKSYKLIRHRLKWDVAKETCVEMGGQLVNVRSQTEQTFIETSITENFDCYWTGGRRTNGVFSWLDGTALDSGYNNWNDNQPDSPPGSEDCVSMYRGYEYRWNDYGCTGTCHVICELT
ncbi:versican core protein-like [Mercenaria mercenaria]|uniref:versican core protein-like n=1 Tax=Mercenaria mercenaria TaxID=6596 RepID=UPI00234EF9D7|nr:versican core protein-like [Mercenaria mercenaria]